MQVRTAVLYASLSTLALPFIASAHEVYVLPPDVVARALAEPSYSQWDVLTANLGLFTLWAFIAILVVALMFLISISRRLEQAVDPWLARLPPYAPVITRITVGVSLLAAAAARALFGPELPLGGTFGSYASLVAVALVVIGLMITFGFYARIAALAALALFAAEAVTHGSYMLTYANYFGELILLLILGAHGLAFHHAEHDRRNAPAWLIALKVRVAPIAVLILRVSFGVSLLYASLYAKVIHDNLALAVTVRYPDIVAFFGFEPHFLVLGAAIIEIVIAIFFILGIEILFTSIFVLFWLSLSLWYFGETVWPHIILIGIPIAFICYGYDRYSLEGYFFKKNGREPVL